MNKNTLTRAPYRNAIRSKMLIRSAFLALLEEKDFSAIKAKDVIERADISKGTFYAHFSSVYSILEEMENEYIKKIEKIVHENSPLSLFEDLLPMWLESFQSFEKDKKFFALLIKCSRGDNFFNQLEAILTNYILTDETVSNYLKSKELAYAYLSYALGGTLVLLKKWFTTPNDDITAEEFAIFLNNCIRDGISTIKKQN